MLTLERAMGHLQKGAPGTVVEVKPLYYSAATFMAIIIIVAVLVTVKMEVSDVQVIELFIH